ncbi:MAG: acetolactate synthase large subunit [Proteobacteria bacterium]|nr:acetolactate synthase large subunit [Pseudomonadota bacterium]
MNGAEIIIKTARAAGVEVCFVNAGTTEIPLVAAFDSEPGIRAILGVFEGVCTGAADGYGRMLDKPAMTLLHHGPGFANGIANLHNARRAQTPLLNIIGDHATWHRHADPPLAMDIEALAGSVSGWFKNCNSVEMLSQDVADAIAATMYGRIASLIVPHDLQLSEWKNTKAVSPEFSYDPVDTDTIERAAGFLRSGKKTAVILGGRALRRRGLEVAGRIKAATGCDLFAGSFPGYMERGAGFPDVVRIPYFPEGAIEMLSRYEAVILAGAKEPVTFFGYNGVPSFILAHNQQKVSIGMGKENIVEAMGYLADLLRAPKNMKAMDGIVTKLNRPPLLGGALTPEKACIILAALQPEDAIIVDEGLTSTLSYYPLTAGLPPHSMMTIAGGSIGYGIPCSVGAAIACPDRTVINFQADGSALYTLQGLWTEARESLNVTTLMCSNRSYNILKMELVRAGIKSPGKSMQSLIELDNPTIDWVKIAEGFGVPAVSVNMVEELAREIGKALAEPGPHLIEMMF